MASTACYRGYECEYEVKNSSLQLRRLSINHQESDLPVSARKQPPRLNGVEATRLYEDLPFVGGWVFNNVELSVPYTGGLILGRGFIQLYGRIGFRKTWEYEQVYEVLFEDGLLVEEADMSLGISRIRERLRVERQRMPETTRKEVESWISATFRRDYISFMSIPDICWLR
jgi:hypothetical protein